MARAELRRRRAEARESGKLLQDKQALEGRLKEVQTVLENVQKQRNDLKQQFRVSGISFLSGASLMHAHELA